MLKIINDGTQAKKLMEEVKMATYSIHAGHNPDGKTACGAVGLIKESTEARKICAEVVKILRAQGHTVYDDTVNDGTGQTDIINKLVKKMNAHTNTTLNVSIHFNSGASDKTGNGKTTGTEVLVYSNSGNKATIAKRVCEKIAGLGYKNRGVKVRTDLGVLRSSKDETILIECCFVDDKDDINLYNYQTMAKAIAEGILGINIKEEEEVAEVKQLKVKINGKYYDITGVFVDGCNYIKVRDLEKAGFKISNEGSTAVIDTK
jgi:N-acetylmuramoyl-L-alanine amidase